MKPSWVVVLLVILSIAMVVVALIHYNGPKLIEPSLEDSPTSFEVMVRGLTGRLNSVPLPVAMLDSLKLEDEQYCFPDTVSFGRTLARARDWMAVEQMFYTLPPDSVTEFNFRELRMLEEAGCINSETRVAYQLKRALIRGDSTGVAQCLYLEHDGRLRIYWYYSPSWEPAVLSNPIVKPDPNAACGYAPSDSSEQVTDVP